MSPSFSSTPLASLVARDISKSFGPHVVLDRVNVTIGPHSRIGVVAPNGTGKSTLLRILAGIDRPDSGPRDADAADRARRLPAPGSRAPAG